MANVQNQAVTPATAKGKPGRKTNAERDAIAAAQAKPVLPVARKAPPVARPGAPKATPIAPPRPATNGATLAAPVAPESAAARVDPEKAQLLATIEAMKGEIGRMTDTIAKLSAKPTAYTEAQIVDGAPELPADDWRRDYHSLTFDVLAFDVSTAKKGQEAGIVAPMLDAATRPHVTCFAAIPRDSDIGGFGASARAGGHLALHCVRREDGLWEGQPVYVSMAELGAIWPEA